MVLRTVAVTLCLLLAACAGSTDFIRFDTGSAAHLGPNDRVLVAVPKDGSHWGKNYPGSGVTTARSVRAAFAEHTERAGPLPDDRNLGDVLKKARQEKYDYLVRPTIFRWGDGKSEGASAPQRVEVKVEVVDVVTEEVVASGLAIGWSDMEASTSDQAESSLSLPLEDFAESLYSSKR